MIQFFLWRRFDCNLIEKLKEDLVIPFPSFIFQSKRRLLLASTTLHFGLRFQMKKNFHKLDEIGNNGISLMFFLSICLKIWDFESLIVILYWFNQMISVQESKDVLTSTYSTRLAQKEQCQTEYPIAVHTGVFFLSHRKVSNVNIANFVC